jgi:hypothetical protein
LIGLLVAVLGLFALAPRQKPAAPGTGQTNGQIGISLDDVYLTRILAGAMSNGTLPIQLSNVQAEILPKNRIKLSGTTSGQFPIHAPLVATAHVQLEAGLPTIQFVSAQVGGLPLPAPVTDALEQPINSKLAQIMANLLPPGSSITGLSTTAHHLLMTIAQQ